MGRYRTIASGALETGDAGLRQNLGELDHGGHILAAVCDVVVAEAASTGKATQSGQKRAEWDTGRYPTLGRRTTSVSGTSQKCKQVGIGDRGH